MNLFLFIVAIVGTGFMVCMAFMHLRRKLYIPAALFLAMSLFNLFNMYLVFG